MTAADLMDVSRAFLAGLASILVMGFIAVTLWRVFRALVW